jgi:hypothetical protein
MLVEQQSMEEHHILEQHQYQVDDILTKPMDYEMVRVLMNALKADPSHNARGQTL